MDLIRLRDGIFWHAPAQREHHVLHIGPHAVLCFPRYRDRSDSQTEHGGVGDGERETEEGGELNKKL